MGAELEWFTDELGAHVIRDNGDLRSWFDEHQCRWALVRPDRYIFGVADDQNDFVALVQRLRAMLEGRRPVHRAGDAESHRGTGGGARRTVRQT